MTRLNCDKNSDHRACRQESTFEVEKYSRFLWSVTMSIGEVGSLQGSGTSSGMPKVRRAESSTRDSE